MLYYIKGSLVFFTSILIPFCLFLVLYVKTLQSIGNQASFVLSHLSSFLWTRYLKSYFFLVLKSYIAIELFYYIFKKSYLFYELFYVFLLSLVFDSYE